MTHVRLDSPVPVKLLESGVFVEEATVPSTHVTVADHPSFADADGTEVFEAVHKSSFVDPVG